MEKIRSTVREESQSVQMGLKQALIIVVLSLFASPSFVQAESPKNIQDHGKAMLRDAEEMVMHGGMGDGKAIVHHCGEVVKHAEAIIKSLPLTDEHGKEALPHLQEAIKQCKRVTEMGDKVDPGASLNPAAKARTAAREAMKHLNALRDSGT
jgi:thioredoxin-like negative regulator of GroEL